jgi:class 3 adenylate cyclase
MRVSGWLVHLTTRALAESMDVRTMTHLVRRLIPNYDIHERTGFPPTIPIPNKNAAHQIVMDVKGKELLLPFINLLISIGDTGFIGRKYRVSHLREIITEICKTGFLYDREFGMFVEDPLVRRTSNWGVLREGEEYIFTFLRLDIVGNSELVRAYPPEVVQGSYTDLRNILQTSIEKRNGRLWNWEGDGGLGSFYFSQKNNAAALCAIEVIHELFLYNHLSCRLEQPLRVRIAVHSGQCQFRHNFEDFNNDTMKQIIEMESSYTKPDSVTFSSNVYTMLDVGIAEQLTPMKTEHNMMLYSYELRWEKGKSG